MREKEFVSKKDREWEYEKVVTNRVREWECLRESVRNEWERVPKRKRFYEKEREKEKLCEKEMERECEKWVRKSLCLRYRESER